MAARVEYKIREANRTAISRILDANHIEKVFEGEVFTAYYDKKHSDFIKTGKRVTVTSTKDGSGILSFRDNSGGVVEEHEVGVSDPQEMDKIMDGLGFTHFLNFKKRRIEYRADDAMFIFEKYLDDLEYIPEFMILEADSEEAVDRWIQVFNIPKDHLKQTTVMDLIKHYRKLAGSVMSHVQ